MYWRQRCKTKSFLKICNNKYTSHIDWKSSCWQDKWLSAFDYNKESGSERTYSRSHWDIDGGREGRKEGRKEGKKEGREGGRKIWLKWKEFIEDQVGDNRKSTPRDFPRGSVVKNLPSNVGDTGLIPGRGTKILHASGQLSPRATTPEHMGCNYWAHGPQQRILSAATKTQRSQKYK